MIGQNAIQVTWIAAIMMICCDARYLLVSLEERNRGELNKIIERWQELNGIIIPHQYYK